MAQVREALHNEELPRETHAKWHKVQVMCTYVIRGSMRALLTGLEDINIALLRR